MYLLLFQVIKLSIDNSKHTTPLKGLADSFLVTQPQKGQPVTDALEIVFKGEIHGRHYQEHALLVILFYSMVLINLLLFINWV